MPTFDQIQTEIASMLSIPDDELDNAQKQAMQEYLDELATQESSKVDGFAQFVKLETARAKAMQEEADRLRQKAQTALNRIGWIKSHYLGVLESYGLHKVRGNAYTISAQERQSVAIACDVDSLPSVLVRTKTTKEPDKQAIKAALEAGEKIDGCSLVKTRHLAIR